MSEEARLPRVASDAVTDPAVRAVFDRFVAERGKVPNLFRVAAHQPAVVETLATHMRAVMGPGTVDVLLKELVSVRVSRINNCEY